MLLGRSQDGEQGPCFEFAVAPPGGIVCKGEYIVLSLFGFACLGKVLCSFATNDNEVQFIEADVVQRLMQVMLKKAS